MSQRYVIGETGARKLTALFNSGLVSKADARQAGIAVEDDFADPFKVVWAQSANSGSGSWIIWLPEGDALVMADGESYDPSDGLTAVGGDYPSGWFVLPDDVIDRSSGGTLYLNVEKVEDEETGEASFEVSFSSEASTETDAYAIEICEASVDSSTSAKSVKQIVTSAIVLGGKCVKSIVGDTDSSEVISGELEISGMLAHGEEETSCGITFTTVGERTDPDTGEKTPARIIANLKDRDGSEDDWGVHEIRFTNTQGQGQVAHVLACGDIEIGGGGGEERKNSNVIGSDYIEVGDQTQQQIPKRVVTAKIATANPNPTGTVEHALLTHDTPQFVRSVKTFTGTGDATSSSKVVVDGPSGKLEVINSDQQRKIKLDASDIPNDCSAKTIQVKRLSFKDKDKNTHTYHGLFCDDIDMTNLLPEGKLISNVTLSPSSASGGFNTIVFTYTDGTTTTVTIQNGIDGRQGDKGEDGETPEITAEVIVEGYTAILADGEQIAVIKDGADGVSPVITMGEGVGTPKIYPIYSNGVQIGSVKDGADGTVTDPVTVQEFITDITFSRSGNDIVANVTKKRGKILALENVGVSTSTIISGVSQNVVAGSSYDTSTHKFTNSVKSVIVINSEDASPASVEVFEATPLTQ